MDVSHSLSHHERLRNRGSIRRLFELGQSGFVYPLRYMWVTREGVEIEGVEAERAEVVNKNAECIEVEACAISPQIDCRVLFTVPKRFHKRANKRNMLRRRVKESYRLQKSLLLDAHHGECNIDLAIIYSTKEQHSYKTINNAVRKILENIAKAL